jgi:hypothetical protein
MNEASRMSPSPITGGTMNFTGGKEAELLQSFYAIPSIDKAWASSSNKGTNL